MKALRKIWSEMAREVTPPENDATYDYWCAEAETMKQRKVEYKAWLRRNYPTNEVDDEEILAYYFVTCDEYLKACQGRDRYAVQQYEDKYNVTIDPYVKEDLEDVQD